MGTTIARTSMTMIILDIIRFVLELCMLNSIFFTSDGLEWAMGRGMLALHRMSYWLASHRRAWRLASHRMGLLATPQCELENASHFLAHGYRRISIKSHKLFAELRSSINF